MRWKKNGVGNEQRSGMAGGGRAYRVFFLVE